MVHIIISQELSEMKKVKYILHKKMTLKKARSFEEVQCFNWQNFHLCTSVSRAEKPMPAENARDRQPKGRCAGTRAKLTTQRVIMGAELTKK